MKKKILLIAAVILVSLGLLSISKIVQDKYLNKNSDSVQQKAIEKTPKEVSLKEDVKEKQVDDKDTVKENEELKAKEEVPKAKVESKPETQQKKATDSKPTVPKTPSTENVPKAPVVSTPEPKKEPNFIVKDDISGKIIFSINISTENKTVGEITLSELDKNGISYKASGRGEAVYFTMINSLNARDFGPLSGWCYYVNGSKPSVSCGAYKLKSSDVVEWKYLKDGVNN